MKLSVRTIFAAIFTLLFSISCEEKLELSAPALSNVSITAVGVNSASFSASITKSGNQAILDHGFTISTSDGVPVIDDNSVKKGAIDMATPTPILLTGAHTNLQIAADYYVHAFIVLQSGPIFSEVTKFKTSEVLQPGIKTDGADSVTYNSIRLRGAIISKGTYPISEYGIVWSGTNNPTTESGARYTVKNDVSGFPHSFATHARGLSPNTTYHYRAYVISNGVTSYGENLNFKTDNEIQPKVQTGDAKPYARGSYLWGEITARGTSAISQYGICWSTGENPTVSGEKLIFSGDVNQVPKSFGGDAINLTPGTTYHYRAFVTMNGVTTYGADRVFQTNTERQPTVITDPPKAGGLTSYLLGRITARGDGDISQYGMCWSTNANPTTADAKFVYNGNITSFPKAITVFIENLLPVTTYHYRAFVTMNGVTTYGANQSFKTSTR